MNLEYWTSRLKKELKETLLSVRELVNQLLQEEAEPSDISFALGMVATELGLEVTNGSVSVIPVVLAGLTDAINSAVDQSSAGDESNGSSVPDDATIH